MEINEDYLRSQLKTLLEIPSPIGRVDAVSGYIKQELCALDVPFGEHRRGSIVATLKGEQTKDDRGISAHLDTLGAMVVEVKSTGRLRLRPLGSWSSRFAEGARVTIYADKDTYRGTIIPIKSAGHVFNQEIDDLPVNWNTVELRVDAPCATPEQASALGIHVGDIIALDPGLEMPSNGYISSRYLDDKAGVACLLAAIKTVKAQTDLLPVECHPIFSVAEEIGCGCSHVPDGDVAELIAVDIGPVAEGQNSSEHCVNIGVLDMSGPYDRRLLKKMTDLCMDHNVAYRLDSYPYYRSDTNSALVAGHDLRHGLIAFGVESTHGYERTHMDSLLATAKLIALYMLSGA